MKPFRLKFTDKTYLDAMEFFLQMYLMWL
jgi:hypothetical protein